MSYPRMKPPVGEYPLFQDDPPPEAFGDLPPYVASSDRAIDAALRSVPLPDGLLTRLGRLVYTMPDKAVGPMDCLGC